MMRPTILTIVCLAAIATAGPAVAADAAKGDLAKLQGIGQKLTGNLRSFVKVDGTTEQLPSR